VLLASRQEVEGVGELVVVGELVDYRLYTSQILLF
tara:strand:- start:7020 stop:7124 length:105 start_codon:yes stop_codon:yes gene_type:complete